MIGNKRVVKSEWIVSSGIKTSFRAGFSRLCFFSSEQKAKKIKSNPNRNVMLNSIELIRTFCLGEKFVDNTIRKWIKRGPDLTRQMDHSNRTAKWCYSIANIILMYMCPPFVVRRDCHWWIGMEVLATLNFVWGPLESERLSATLTMTVLVESFRSWADQIRAIRSLCS
jgi:hypothetical protein